MKTFKENIKQRMTARHIKSMKLVNVENKVLLDIGCSHGWFEDYAVKNKCRKICAIDTNRSDIENAMKEVPEAEFKYGSVLKIPYKSDYFDIVVMWEVLEHIPKNTEKSAFKEIKRILKKDGVLFISTPTKNFWSCILDPAWFFGHRHYKISEIENLVDKTGLKILNIEIKGGFYEQFSMILFYIFKWVFRSEMPFREFFEKKKRKEFLGNKEGFTTIFAELRN
ncbi:MAG: class I SAM-dependent methyltransferase [Candidatus Cloacimonetes bacterium]|nr:class I SAM-dependent methyltransferase [Candidatus Cloacimonadota bacterium]